MQSTNGGNLLDQLRLNVLQQHRGILCLDLTIEQLCFRPCQLLQQVPMPPEFREQLHAVVDSVIKQAGNGVRQHFLSRVVVFHALHSWIGGN